MPATANTHTIDLPAGLPLTLTEAGSSGHAILLLHGGGGPATVAGLGAALADAGHQVLAPTHPGWDGTPRPDWVDSIGDLAALYLALLEDRGLTDVTVVGSSIGGWIASEMAASDLGGRIGRLVIIDGVGVLIEGEPMADFFALDPRGVVEHSFHDPDRFFVDPSTLPAEALAARAANGATLRLIAGDPYMHDPGLLRRLGQVRVPVLVLWGESDRIATPAYGRAYAAAFASARFELIPRAGHLPQLEQPAATLAAVLEFTPSRAAARG